MTDGRVVDVRIGMLPNAGGALGDTNLPALTDSALPNTIPSSGTLASGNQNLVATITAGGGTTSLTIDTATTNAATSVTIYHDDTQAFQTAFNAIAAGAGTLSILDVPPGTYNVDQASYWSTSLLSWVYTNPPTSGCSRQAGRCWCSSSPFEYLDTRGRAAKHDRPGPLALHGCGQQLHLRHR